MRDLDERCARALGIEGAVNGRPCYFVPGHVNAFFVPPAFSASLDWARMLEDEVEKRGLQERYVEALYPAYHSFEGILVADLFVLIHATPEQRARAFLKAVEA